MSRLRHTAVLLGALLALAAPSAALASPSAVIRDCASDGVLDKRHSTKDLKRALDRLPSDLDEYSDCREVIGAAIDEGGTGVAGGPGGGGLGTGAGAGATQEDLAALEEATSGKPPTVNVGGRRIRPGSSGLFELETASQGLPLPLTLSLVALGLLALGGTAYALRRRFPALAGLRLKPSLPSLRRVPLPRLRR